MRYPLPVPFGWFGVGWGDSLAVGEVRALYAFDVHLVIWRDDLGVAHVQDAFCPHLGAHLGHGGTVVGAEVMCPFHGWRYDAEGRNTDIPYSTRCNAKARLRTYPTVERNGMVMVWWHPDPAVEPQWEVPTVDVVGGIHAGGGPDWGDEIRTEHTFDAHVQEMAENQVDSAHFMFVHRNPEVPEIQSYETGFPTATMRVNQRFVTPSGPVPAVLEVVSYGAGMSIVRMSGVVETIDVAYPLPVTAERSMVRSGFRFQSLGDAELTEAVGRAFVDEVHRQMVQEDGPIWEHKAYLRRPALAVGDGPFTQFRAWAGQFHPTPVVDGADRWPSPYWPDRLDEVPAGISSGEQLAGVLTSDAGPPSA